MVATSFQAAGGAGQKGIDELAAQVAAAARDVDALVNDGARPRRSVEHKVHANTLAFNVVPCSAPTPASGYTDEEMKLQNESRKILDIPDLRVSPTCVRVPVMVGHAIAVRATFARDRRPRRGAGGAGARSRTSSSTTSPTPLEWAGRDEIAVGRVRRDLADPQASTSSSSATTCSRAPR